MRRSVERPRDKPQPPKTETGSEMKGEPMPAVRNERRSRPAASPHDLKDLEKSHKPVCEPRVHLENVDIRTQPSIAKKYVDLAGGEEVFPGRDRVRIHVCELGMSLDVKRIYGFFIPAEAVRASAAAYAIASSRPKRAFASTARRPASFTTSSATSTRRASSRSVPPPTFIFTAV